MQLLDMWSNFHCNNYIPSPNPQKRIRPHDKVINDEVVMKWWWKLWWNYDEIKVKTASKCLARIKGCWDPEFEPSVEEIMDYRLIYIIYMAIFSVRTRGDSLFSLAHGRWRSYPDQPAQATRPNIHVYGACAVCRYVLVRIMAAYSKRGAILMRASGCSP